MKTSAGKAPSRLRWLLLPVILVVAPLLIIVVLALTLDPSRLKPLLVQTAQEQGYDLSIPGDLHWSLFPRLGISLGELQLKNGETGEKLVDVQQASVAVALMPLFSRQVEVASIALTGVDLLWQERGDGQSNWPKPKADKTPDAQAPKSTGTLPDLHISNIALQNIALTWKPLKGETLAVTGLNLDVADFNTRSQPFTADLSGLIERANAPSISLGVRGDFIWHQAESKVQFQTLNGTISPPNGDLSVSFNGNLGWEKSVYLNGELAVATGDLRQFLQAIGVVLPATQSADAFSRFNLSARLAAADDEVIVQAIRLAFDQSQLTGQVAIKQGVLPDIRAQLQLDQITLDDYLSPASALPDAPKSPAAEAVALPLTLLRTLALDIAFSVEQLRYKALSAQKTQLGLKAKKGQWTFSPLVTQLAEGQVSGSASMRVSERQADVSGNLSTQALSLGALMAGLQQPDTLAGLMNSQLRFSTFGATDLALKNNLTAEFTADSAQVKLNAINVEQKVCQALSLVSFQEGRLSVKANDNPDIAGSWPTYTELSPVNVQASVAAGKVTLNQLSANIQKLKAESQGELDLATGDFRFPLDVKLAEFSGGLSGCLALDDHWRNSVVPLRCKGNIANIDAKVCLPDGPRLTEMAKTVLKTKLNAKVDTVKAELGDKVSAEANELLEKNLDSEKLDALKGSLKGLFKEKPPADN
jgi:AsmA protein